MRRLWISLFAVCVFAFVACSGSRKAEPTVDAPTKTAAAPKKVYAQPRYSVKLDSAELLRLEIAHGSFLRAIALQAQGENAIAEQFMQHAYAADPENRFLAFSVLELMEERGATAEAAQLAEKAKNLKGKKTSTQYALLGRIYGEQSNLDSAVVYYKKAVDASDQNLHAAYEYALLLEITRDYDELSRIYGILLPQIGYPQSILERQISLLATAKKDSALADLFGEVYEARGDRSFLENRIRLLLAMKHFEDALKSVEEFRADSAYADDSLSVRFVMAVYSGLKQDSVALDTLREIYKRNPERGDVLLDLSLFETKLGKKEQAIIHWQRLSGMETYAAISFGMLSAYALESGDSAQSLTYLEKAYEKAPMAYRNKLLVRYSADKNYAKAYAILDKALLPNEKYDTIRTQLMTDGKLEEMRKLDLEIAMDKAKLYYEYGTLLQMNAEDLERAPTTQARKDSAMTLRKQATDQYVKAGNIGGDSQNLLFAYGSNLLMFGMVDSAIVVFKRIFSLYPMDVVAKNHLGYTLVDLNRNAEEVKWGSKLIDDAIQQDPKNIAYRDSKAWALYRAGKFEEALKIMEGIEAEKDSLSDEMMHDPSIFSHMAAICEALALKKRAVEYYEKVLTIDPQNENAKSRIEILKKKEE